MEYSLTDKKGLVRQFDTLSQLIAFIKAYGEIDGWILRIHHM